MSDNTDNNKKYWKGLEELHNDPEFQEIARKEFPYKMPINGQDPDEFYEHSHRRDFLKFLGFSVAAASLAACEAPVKKAIPYLNKPDEVDPSVPNYYASSYIDGGDYCSVIVKTREGRPIKIESNPLSSVSGGGLSTRASSSVLSLYDNERIKGPKAAGKNTSWEKLDGAVKSGLESIAAAGQKTVIVTQSILSPSLKQALADFQEQYPGAAVVTYDPDSVSAMLDANQKSFGVRALPSYAFDKAKVVVSFEADFLGTWFNHEGFSKQYAQQRKLGKNKKTLNRHYHYESALSLTGSNADYRVPVKPSDQLKLLVKLHNIIASKTGGTKIGQAEAPQKDKYLQKAADDLLAHKGHSLVVCGVNNEAAQLITNSINHMLDNYGHTLNIDKEAYFRQGNDKAMNGFIDELKNGQVKGVIFFNANPVYDHPRGEEIKAAIQNTELSVSTADRIDETAALVQYVAPDHHYLESWGDAQPIKGYYSLMQPAITPLFKTRAALESFLTWTGNKQEAYQYIKAYWRKNLYPLQKGFASFRDFWDRSLHDGVFEPNKPLKQGHKAKPVNNHQDRQVKSDSLKGMADSLSVAADTLKHAVQSGAENNASGKDRNFKFNIASLSLATEKTAAIEYTIYEKGGIGNGKQANNPWLQEFPDPVTKACWDNYITISPKFGREKDLKSGDIVKLETNKGTINLPVLLQPGQAYGTVSAAIGYGRTHAGKAANHVGKNVYPLIRENDGRLEFNGIVKNITKTGEFRQIAQTQTHHTMMGRPIVQDAELKEWQKNPAAGKVSHSFHTSEGTKHADEISIWNTEEGHELTHGLERGHHWGMVIDLNSCTGCGSCIIGCQSENNVPVVGRQEVINRREMHWIRIDRYYSSQGDPDNPYDKDLEDPEENPQVTFMPMTCQHCNQAPCETVCPVLATTHSAEGLNMMAYNRCVGTRYCANNCPYKVRRFNWFRYYDNNKFDYNLNNDLGKMQLNPDVTVRSRGVMEKCTMCVQRIQAGKLEAKKEGRPVKDGDINTACADACPTNAITFGDMNDKNSTIGKTIKEEKDKRLYHVLEELNTRPSVSYLTKIRNKDQNKA